MPVEFIGMIHHRHQSEIRPPPDVVVDRGYIRDFAQAAEDGGFDRVLVGYFSDSPDGFLVAAHAAAYTERLGFLVAHRPGFVAPTWRRGSLRHSIRSPAGARRYTLYRAVTMWIRRATATICRRMSATLALTSMWGF